MTISLNGEPYMMPRPISVAALLREMGWHKRRVAIEVNGEIVPKSQHQERLLQPQDRIEIVQAMGGG